MYGSYGVRDMLGSPQPDRSDYLALDASLPPAAVWLVIAGKAPESGRKNGRSTDNHYDKEFSIKRWQYWMWTFDEAGRTSKGSGKIIRKRWNQM